MLKTLLSLRDFHEVRSSDLWVNQHVCDQLFVRCFLKGVKILILIYTYPFILRKVSQEVAFNRRKSEIPIRCLLSTATSWRERQLEGFILRCRKRYWSFLLTGACQKVSAHEFFSFFYFVWKFCKWRGNKWGLSQIASFRIKCSGKYSISVKVV